MSRFLTFVDFSPVDIHRVQHPQKHHCCQVRLGVQHYPSDVNSKIKALKV